MNIEDLQTAIRGQVSAYGYTEVDGEDFRALPIGWVDSRGYQTAYQGHTDTYVVYHRRPATYGRGLEDLADVQRRFNEPYDAMDAIRWSMLQTPFSRDDFASRVLERSRSRVDGGDLAVRGERPPAQMTEDEGYNWPPFANIPFMVDDTLPHDTLEFRGPYNTVRVENVAADEPLRTATAATIQDATRRVLENTERRLEEMIYGDGPGDSPELVGRDEHYRVSDSACVCGFETHTTGVMDEHLAEVPNHVAAEGPRYWKRCERCGNSVLCRRIAVSRHTLPAWGAPTSDVPPPTPTIDVVYRCDRCSRGL